MGTTVCPLKGGLEMHCKDVCDLLSLYLDGYLESEEQREVTRHLESCVACQVLYTDLRHTVELVQGLPEVTPPAGFRKQLREQLQSFEQPVPVTTGSAKLMGRVGRRNWPGLLAAAAVLVVALGISGLWQGDPARWAASGEDLLARVFTGSGHSDKLAMEDRVQTEKQGDLEHSVDQLSQNGSTPPSKDVPENMKYDLATVPAGRGGEDLPDEHAPSSSVDNQTMVGLSVTGTEGEPMMAMTEEPYEASRSSSKLTKEAHLALMVTEPVRVAAEIAELSQQHNARVTTSAHGDGVTLKLEVALAGFEPLWEELQSYGKVLDSSIKDIDLSRDFESTEAAVQKLLRQQEELSQSAKSDQLKIDLLEQQRLLQKLQKQADTVVIKLDLNKPQQ